MPSSAEYRCPGERYTIPRAVHLARLAAYYPKCRECSFRVDAGHETALPIIEAPQPAGSPLFHTNGIRGRYINEIDRHRAGELAAAFASVLWEDAPPTVERLGRPGPTVVIGFDERPSSPDIVAGAALALRRMGCQVVDVGLCTRPCLWFAVHHLNATGGVFVNGSGSDPSFTGLDFVGRNNVPASVPGTLQQVSERWAAGVSRATRTPGGQRTFPAWVPYESGLWKHFAELESLTVVAGCASIVVRDLLQRLLPRCRLTLVELPVRAAKLTSADDPDVVHVGEWVRERQADVGFVIGDDAQQTIVLDEHGRSLPPLKWLDVLDEFLQLELAPPAGAVRNQTSFAATVEAMRTTSAPLAGDTAGYVWFDEGFPTADAMLTVARSLQALSRLRKAGGVSPLVG